MISLPSRMFSFARVQVLLNVATSSPRTITVELEGEESIEAGVQYESIPCSECLSARHISTKCPFRMKPGLLKTPAQATILIVSSTSEDLGPETDVSLQAPPATEVRPQVPPLTTAFAFTDPRDSGSTPILEVLPKEQGIQNLQVSTT